MMRCLAWAQGVTKSLRRSAGLPAAAVCTMVLMTGCAASPPPSACPAPEKSRVFAESFDAVWSALIGVLADKGEFIAMAEKESGALSFQKVIPLNEINVCACNDTGLLWSRAHAQVVILVSREDAEHTKVTINTVIIGEGRNVIDVFLSRTRQVSLPSRGRLERSYLDLLTAKIAAKASVPDKSTATRAAGGLSTP